jgi:hypothetical protein
LPSEGSITSHVMLSVVSSMNGVDVRRGGVRHQQHVGGLDALPACDRRAVERMPALELVIRELLARHGDVLLLAAGIGEAKVDELDVLLLEHLEDVGGAGHAISLLAAQVYGALQ